MGPILLAGAGVGFVLATAAGFLAWGRVCLVAAGLLFGAGRATFFTPG